MRTRTRTPKSFSLLAVIAGVAISGCSLAPTTNAGGGGSGNGTSNPGGGSGNGTSNPAGGSGNSNPGGGSGNNTSNGGLSSMAGTAPVMQDDATCMADNFVRANKLAPIDPSVPALVQSMTTQQKLSILNGGPLCPNYDCDFNATGIPSLGFNDMPMHDGPRGVHILDGGKSTTWAIAEARAATFDTALELKVGTAQGEEMRAFKYDVSLAPTINVLRHPGWARAQETYGEDPVLVGEMGAAFSNGLQANIIACPKHFAGNDTDNNRHVAYAQMDEQTLRENYTRAFDIIVEKADPGCIMAAYNGLTVTDSATDKSGHWCTESHHLLTDIARTEFNWGGFMISDWWATKANGPASINAGLDLEMPSMDAFQQLPGAIGSSVQITRVDEAATRILNARQHFGHMTAAYKNSAANPGIVTDAGHIALAKQTSEEGAVLLKNDGILPLGPAATTLGTGSPTVKTIVVMGPDATIPDASKVATSGTASGLGDRGSSDTYPPYAVSYIQGLTTLGKGIYPMVGTTPPSDITIVTGGTTPSDASKGDVVIIPVSMAHEDEGEAYDGGADRQNLTLTDIHPLHWTGSKPAAFIKAVAAVNPNVIVLLNVGSAIVMEDWMASAKGIVQTFYPGQEGGNAIAELLFGKLNFSGKLPFTVAINPNDYPPFQNNSQNAMTFDYFHGYRKFEAQALTPRFWFGYGASYTTYKYSDFKVLCSNGISKTGRLNVEVTVTNTGKMDGDEIVQLYVGYPTKSGTIRRPPKELKSFARVHIPAGMSQVVQLTVPAKYIAYYDGTKNINGWSFEPAGYMYNAIVAGSSDPKDPNLLSAPFTIN